MIALPMIQPKGLVASSGDFELFKGAVNRPSRKGVKVDHRCRSYHLYQYGEKVAVFVTGNMKIADSIIFDLPVKITCPGMTELCEAICYAAIEHLYPSVGKNRAMNYEFAQSRDFVAGTRFAIAGIIKHVKGLRRPETISRVRLHTAGDFFSTNYFAAWTRIIDSFPSLRFWAYTKSSAILDQYSKAVLSGLVAPVPSNLNLRFSVDPTTKEMPQEAYIPHAYLMPKGEEETISKREAKDLGFLYCPAIGSSVRCGDCNLCYATDYSIIFKEH